MCNKRQYVFGLVVSILWFYCLFIGSVFQPIKIEFNLFKEGFFFLLIMLINNFIDKNFKVDAPTNTLPFTKIKK
tara:strand:- start:710 stop:931 length:222 start_codon:yes stop_codon:yes gene_type:complete